MRNGLLPLLLLCCGFQGFAQRQWEYRSSLSGQAATEKTLPMWATTGRHGIIPDSRGGLLQAGLFSDFNPERTIRFAYGVSGAGYLTEIKNKIILDELYVSAEWKKIRLDAGMIHADEAYNGISSQNGNIVFSGNSRSLPGLNLRTGYIGVPLTGKVLAFRFNIAGYTMIDDRYADHTWLHNKSLYLRISPWKRLDISVGLEHWAQWGGDSPAYGKQPHSFRDFIRVFCAQGGGEGSTVSDSLNALGNHLGREHLRIDYKADAFTLGFYHDIPFEDGSGTRFQNFPDGTWGLYYGAYDKKQWVSDVMYEFIYTKSQSGSHHDRPATPEEIATQDPHSPFYGRVVLGGNDNYFNNGEYRSGWTYYGRGIGTPFITPKAPDANGLVLGTYNNRIIAHYLGIQGYAFRKLPYKVRLSYSRNYGTYSSPLTGTPEQFSFGLEAGIPRSRHLPFRIDLGIYGDYGKLYSNNFGLSLKISRNGVL